MARTLGVFLLSSALLLIACEAAAVFEHTSGDRTRRATTGVSSGDDKDEFLDVHNDYREDAGSSNMRKMVWNDTLATNAYNWIKQCTQGHPDNLNGEGQNMYYKYSSQLGANVARPTPSDVVESWHDEIEDYHYGSTSCNSGSVCGHYTQVVWADTYQIGCAMEDCDEIVIKGVKRTGWVAACNYSPGGNYQGVKPYKEGDACASCDLGERRCKDNLCSDCTSGESGCECNIQCPGGGSTTTDCKCESCPAGLFGDVCEKVCENTSSACGQNPGLPEQLCDSAAIVRDKCPLMCGICTAAT